MPKRRTRKRNQNQRREKISSHISIRFREEADVEKKNRIEHTRIQGNNLKNNHKKMENKCIERAITSVCLSIWCERTISEIVWYHYADVYRNGKKHDFYFKRRHFFFPSLCSPFITCDSISLLSRETIWYFGHILPSTSWPFACGLHAKHILCDSDFQFYRCTTETGTGQTEANKNENSTQINLINSTIE